MSHPDVLPPATPPGHAPARRGRHWPAPTRRRFAVPARARPWLRAATLAAAAAIGALVGFGISDGASLARLGAVTLRLRGLPEFVSPDRGAVGAALLGGAHVALVSGIWGACAGALNARLVGRLRPAGSAAVLAGFGVLLALADGALPATLRLAAGALSPAERVVVALTVSTAAWFGSRFGADMGASPDSASDASEPAAPEV